MAVSLAELADLVGGELSGDGQLQIIGAAILQEAGPGHITLADERNAPQLTACAASAVVVHRTFSPRGIPFITVDDVRGSFAHIVSRFSPPRTSTRTGISPAAFISPSAFMGDDVDIYPGAFVGDDVRIERGCTIHAGVRIMDGCHLAEDVVVFPNAVLYENSIVGPRTIIHAGAIIGAYGFGYEQRAGRHVLSPQLGNVVIQADVEIGAGTTIDRGTFGPTRIGEGTKIDNQVMIGHNCQVGRHNLFCAQVGLAGSCTTGDQVVLAGQVGLRDHVRLGDGVVVGAQSGVSDSLAEPGQYLGSPAIPARQEIQALMARQKLPEMRKDLRRLEKRVASMEAQSANAACKAA